MPARQGLHHSVGSSKDTFQLAWPVIGNFNVYRGERRTPSGGIGDGAAVATLLAEALPAHYQVVHVKARPLIGGAGFSKVTERPSGANPGLGDVRDVFAEVRLSKIAGLGADQVAHSEVFRGVLWRATEVEMESGRLRTYHLFVPPRFASFDVSTGLVTRPLD